MNWRKVKAEYIAGGITQRALAEKHGISVRTIERRAQKENWTKRRRDADGKTAEKIVEKTAEIVADNATLCEKIKTTLLQKLAALAAEFPTGGTEIKKRFTNGDEITYRLRDIAAVYQALSEKIPAGMSADIEDLSPLTELLRDE